MIVLNDIGDGFITLPEFSRQLREYERNLFVQQTHAQDYFTKKHKADRMNVRKRLRRAFYRARGIDSKLAAVTFRRG